MSASCSICPDSLKLASVGALRLPFSGRLSCERATTVIPVSLPSCLSAREIFVIFSYLSRPDALSSCQVVDEYHVIAARKRYCPDIHRRHAGGFYDLKGYSVTLAPRAFDCFEFAVAQAAGFVEPKSTSAA